MKQIPPTPESREPRMHVELPPAERLIHFYRVAELIAAQLAPDGAGARMAWLMKLQERGTLVFRWRDGLPIPSGTLIGGFDGEQDAHVLALDLGRWLLAMGYEVEHVAGHLGVDKVSEEMPRRVPAFAAQEEAILLRLRELGFDPLALPKTPAGKSSPAKRAVQQSLGYSKDVMKKAWQRLLNDGRVVNA